MVSNVIQYLREVDDHLELQVHAKPGAKNSKIVGPHGAALKIAIGAPPEDGKANLALIDFLSETLGVTKRSIEIMRGTSAKQKCIKIVGITLSDAIKKLGAH